ncbi:TetR/AcrR family transcriptional regulator [Novosphingobium sp. M1R2S20]|uniref:TetR/AcrR family transcriptional regulator n=1 Tax=Novosphingobium rhizovicinum TaxID=3228928 RepID=A0ABV3RF02_9SPHN
MTVAKKKRQGRPHKGYDQTHREMIETAVRLISEKGAEGLSVAVLAREMGISRANVYYHFANREALLDAVKVWASDQLARGMDESWPVTDRTVGITRFVLENPELVKLWIDDFISGDDVRQSYTRWEPLVQGLQQRFDEQCPDEEIDAEVYCTIMLTSAFIAPRIFARSVRPDLPLEAIVARFVKEQHRVLRRDGLDWEA